ncbi:LysM peptidoglycan-binding domain-containing protein [Thiorhodococcus mannitoliphagus]|uniref:LysM peptidoglycan-binding domain-containing protein n=1 Tax=Thiorhodococcus mannitoliphagus TaxID=329406 RepID=A0A6P1E028_9GAMM|nr:haloacid dehalogenase-like hydrolase [Thiorhodococcus mannitoliphagus]NEX22376.1 LysM peptidoglycan-binding domain-containing protein [Thiorhodococcus mannitoliphagus]
MKKPSILKPPFTTRFKAAWSVLALTACLSVGSAQAADQGARHHAKGEYDSVTAIYEVVEGDELIVIGERFQVPLDTLKAENHLTSDLIKPGQKLTITTDARTVSTQNKTREASPTQAQAPEHTPDDPLSAWNDGPAKQAIMAFVKETTTPGSPTFVPPAERIATFDQDGTLWVEHPMYSQVVYCLERIPAVVKAKPELAQEEPFKTVLSGDREAIAKLPMDDLIKILAATLTGMDVDEFNAEAEKWLATAKNARWNRPYTDLTYLPMQELMEYLRAKGYKTYIVTGGGQDFVRVYSESAYGIPPEQVVGSAGETKYGYRKDGKPFLTKEPKLLLNDNNAGKPEGIHLMIGRRPQAAFGNSTGDRQMLEYTKAGDGARLSMILLHDDAEREYAYGPAQGLPDTKVGTFTQALYDEAQKQGWIVISMKTDWNRIFAFEEGQD